MANQSQHAGTIANPIPQRLLYKKGDKVYTVATGPSTSGPTTDVVEATDTQKGITRLSDAIDSDSNAATGVTAATPLAVKTVHDKVTALEAKDAEQDKKLESVENTLTDHSGRLDALEAGGTGGGGLSYVVTPKILTPTNGAVGQNTKITITGSGYENVFPTDARKHRIFELSKAQDFGTKLETKEADADSMKFDTQLDAQTKYYARIKDVSQKEYRSNWSPVVEFTTGDVTHANTPVITLKGYADSPTDIGSGLTIEGGAYSVNDSSADTHKATSWSIRLKTGRANVWESLNDTTNKTSIEVPKGTLQKSTAYIVTVIYHSTNFNDSSPAEQEFTTSSDFGTVQAPVITILGEPDKILETPSFRGGVFSCTRDPDTHESTEIQVIKSQDQSTVWTHTAGGATTSVTIPKGKLTVSTQYKVKMRYKGAAYGWSEWAEKDFTTAAEFVRYLHIGIPGTEDFGVGLATEDVLNSIQPKPKALTNTNNHGHFEYGLYLASDFATKVNVRNQSQVQTPSVAFLKCIPKFYYAFLQKDANGTNLNDSELDALLPYVEVTKEQMKEAQRRSPYNALVIAPASSFVDRADAAKHNFYLPRSFINNGKEKPCFFISNSCALYTFDGSELSSSGPLVLYGAPEVDNKYKFARGENSSNQINLGSIVDCINNLHVDDITLASTFALATISLLSLIHGQYATSNNYCAWYDSNLATNYPKGINATDHDTDDPTVAIASAIQNTRDYVSDPFPVDVDTYAKTTHNGCVSGITHINGWYWEINLGVICKEWSGMLSKGRYSYISEDIDIKTINSGNLSSSFTQTTSEYYPYARWGNSTASVFKRDGTADPLMGILPANETNTTGTNEFGNDQFTSSPNDDTAIFFSGWNSMSKGCGVFHRTHSSSTIYTRDSHTEMARVMAYPNEMVTVTATADYEGAEPKKQTIKVPSGTSDTDAKSQLAVPVSEKYRFKEWQKA